MRSSASTRVWKRCAASLVSSVVVGSLSDWLYMSGLCRPRVLHWKCDGLQGGQVEPFGSLIDVEPDNVTGRININTEAIGHPAHFRARFGSQFNTEAVGLCIVVELHDFLSR